MFGHGASGDALNVIEAISKSQAVIEFDLKGNILTANENFCRTVGYSLQEIVGRHHSMFCDPDQVKTQEYKDFWAKLGSGHYDSGCYRRVGKGGREIWIQASYNPVFRSGKLYKIVKMASDITDAKHKAVEDAGKLSAISRSQAVIEFTPNGDIITANENFCSAMGYELSEIVGRHHRIFCRADYANTADYQTFWKRLAAGEFVANEFVRVSKSGREVWIQAAYNPILDSSGKVSKVVKFATDVTQRMQAIKEVNDLVEAMAEGDLTHSLKREFVPSMEELRENLNRTVLKLNDALNHVAENAAAIASGSREISSASDSFSRRTEQQAASLEETAAALEEITTAVSETSGRAHTAGELVARTKGYAETSGTIVRDAVAAVSKIENSSNEISNIIGVIDEIAFQTNLLALNAGVEAARAGEAGKGFAVVAQEVRELAQRSAKAAKEIKVLINTSGEHVQAGVDLVGRAGTSLEQIAEKVAQIDGNVAAIVSAAKEQSAALKEIAAAVNQLDQATQQNAAMVEESTAASADLAERARSLDEILNMFKVGPVQASGRAVPMPQRRAA